MNSRSSANGPVAVQSTRAAEKLDPGMRFHRWEVIRPITAVAHRSDGRYFRRTDYECRCACGAVRVVRARLLVKGLSKSCGCVTKSPVLAPGTVIGRLTIEKAIHFTKRHSVKGHIYSAYRYQCVCECGMRPVVLGSSLLNRKRPTLSCGCFQADRVSGVAWPEDLALFRGLYRTYCRAAQNRGYEWEIPFSIFVNIIQRPCEYCGMAPQPRKWKRLTKKGLGAVASVNGVDRVDNSIGYIQGNVVAACTTCNMAKKCMSADAYVEHCKRVAARSVPPSGYVWSPEDLDIRLERIIRRRGGYE